MQRRCPASRVLGSGRLMNHRFFIMAAGFASVERVSGSVVHGVLWELALADVAALDRFEDVANGLYVKLTQPILRPGGGVRALVYVGRSVAPGRPRPGYLEAVVAAGTLAGLPPAYLASLGGLARNGTRGEPFVNVEPEPLRGPVAGVRPRFATPFDRD